MPDLQWHPTAEDVEVMFKSTSYWPTSAAKEPFAREQCETAVLSARAEWERLTGYTPFLSTNPAAQTYDFWIDAKRFPQDGVLNLGNGLLRIDSVRVGGVVVPLGQFIPKPDNAPQKGAAYQWLKFLNRRYGRIGAIGERLHIQVTGRWGYCVEYPADAWQNILQAAGLIALTQIENLQSIASLSQDGFSKALDVVGIISQKDTADRWRHEFPAAVKRYKWDLVI